MPTRDAIRIPSVRHMMSAAILFSPPAAASFLVPLRLPPLSPPIHLRAANIITSHVDSDIDKSLGLTWRERRRLQLGKLPFEALPEERLGLAGILLLHVSLLSKAILMATGSSAAPTPSRDVLLPALWDVPAFGFLTVAVSMLLQLVLEPKSLDGQGPNRALRSVGYYSYRGVHRAASLLAALGTRPPVRRARARMASTLGRLDRYAQRLSRRVASGLQHAGPQLEAFCRGAGVSTTWHRLVSAWRNTPLATALVRFRSHVAWNWNQFVKEAESRERQEWMAAQLQIMVERRKRAEGESR